MDIKIKILAVVLVASGFVAITGIQSSANSGVSKLDSVVQIGNNIQKSDYSEMESVSPTGAELREESDYRFSNNNGNIVYGPYYLKGKKYYYYDGSVLDSEFSNTNKPEIEGLHNFYLKTYTDPLFYSPAENHSAYNFSSINAAETGKLLTQECGLEYDVVPEKYYSSLSENVVVTEKFFEHASLENANNLIQQNKQTTTSYSDMVGNYVDLLSKNLSDNKCFGEDAEYNGLNVQTPTPNQIKINDEVLVNVFRLANENSKELERDIDRRSEILQGKSFALKTRNVSVSEASSTLEADYTPEEAVEEMNLRRRFEKLMVGGRSQSSYDGDVSEDDYSSRTEYLDQDEQETSDSNPYDIQEDNNSVEYVEDGVQSRYQDDEAGDQSNESGIPENYRSYADNLPDYFESQVKTVKETQNAYDLSSVCVESSTVPVYGWDKEIYPNVISGKKLEFRASSYVQEEIAPNIFSSCNCPTGGLTSLSWYVVDGLFNEVEGDRLFTDFEGENSKQIKTAENVFLADPGENTAGQLGQVYENALTSGIKKDSYSSGIPKLWKRSVQQKSKLEKLKGPYSTFYNEEHMDIWRGYFDVDEDEVLPRAQYNYFLVTESQYMMDMMAWSDSVWRLEEQPPKTLEDVA